MPWSPMFRGAAREIPGTSPGAHDGLFTGHRNNKNNNTKIHNHSNVNNHDNHYHSNIH